MISISRIATKNKKVAEVKHRIAWWLFIFLLITTFSDMRLYYYQSKIDDIAKVEFAYIIQEINTIQNNKIFSGEANITDISNLKNTKEELNFHHQRLSLAKFYASLYVCLITGFALFKPDSFLIHTLSVTGLFLVITNLLISML